MAKLGKTELPQTRSDFTVVGKVMGTKKDKFYEQKTDKNGNPYRELKFGVEFEEGKTVYVSLKGQVQADAYFNRSANKEKNIPQETKKVKWDKRFSFKENGFYPMGVAFRLEPKSDEKEVNTTSLWEYDACEKIAQKLAELGDETVVRVNGKMERYSKKDGGVVTKFVISKIYLSDAKLEEDNIKNHFFHQNMVVTGVETVINEKNNQTSYFIQGYDCKYNTLEAISLPTEQVKLVQNFKKKLKNGYFSITVYGDIRVIKEEVQVEVADEYGESDVTLSSNGFTSYDLFVRGADAETLDLETYTTESVERAIELTNVSQVASEDYGETNEVIEESEENEDLSNW